MDKVIAMCLIHDLGECFTGDIPHVFEDPTPIEYTESSLPDRRVQQLPAAVSTSMQDLYREMDAMETEEARLCKALDKLEAVIQHNESPVDLKRERIFPEQDLRLRRRPLLQLAHRPPPGDLAGHPAKESSRSRRKERSPHRTQPAQTIATLEILPISLKKPPT